MEQSKFTMRGTRHSGEKQIRICALNNTTDEDSTAAGNQLYTPEPSQDLKLRQTDSTGDRTKHNYKSRERKHDKTFAHASTV